MSLVQGSTSSATAQSWNTTLHQLQQEGDLEESTRSDDTSLIDPAVKGNRLYQRVDGSIGLHEKPVGYVIGEKVIAPLIDSVTSLAKYTFNFGLDSFTYINRMLTFPSAYASSHDLRKIDAILMKTIWVNGPTYNHKVGNTGHHADKSIYNPPDGWAIKDYKKHEHVKYGHSGYSISLVAGGSKFSSLDEMERDFNKKIEASDGDKKYYLTEAKNDYIKLYKSIDASHQTLVLDAHATGEGLFQGGGRLHVELEVELVNIDYLKSIQAIERNSIYVLSLNSVLKSLNIRTEEELRRMSEDDKINTLTVEISKRQSLDISYLHSLSTDELIRKLAIDAILKNMNIRTEEELRRMSEDDKINTLTVEISKRQSLEISHLQSLCTDELIQMI